MNLPGRQSTDDRLSQISTLWTVLFKAHASGDAAILAKQAQVERYSGAVYRYLLGAVRNEQDAHDLANEFAVRFLRGDFHRADPQRGRFRDYLKTTLIHLVNDHHRERQKQPGPLPQDSPAAEPVSEDTFLADWREALLDRSWQALRTTNARYHAVLLHRINNPDDKFAQIAEDLSSTLGEKMTDVLVRKTLQRAQAKFADLLIEEVTATLEQPSAESLEQELRELDLMKYCQPAFERWRERNAKESIPSNG